MDSYFNDKKCTKEIYIFGVTLWGLAIACYFKQKKHQIFFLDNNKELHNKTVISQIECLDPVKTNPFCTHYICVKKETNKFAICQQLTEYGCADIRILDDRMDKYLEQMDDADYLRCFWYLQMNTELDLLNPKTFNEKIQWLKLNDRQSRYGLLVDKYEVKEHVAKIIGDQYINPTIGVWENANDIDFGLLPDNVILKCTHDSGSLMFVSDNKDKQYYCDVRRELNQKLEKNFFYWGREWVYKGVHPRIIAENVLINDDGSEIEDYKFLCFNGVVKCIFVCSERQESLKVTFFDINWKRLPFIRHYPASSKIIEKPKKLDEMIHLAEKLSKDIPFVRIDFFLVNDNPIFSEYTFYPGCGIEEFIPEKWDYVLGEWLNLI